MDYRVERVALEEQPTAVVRAVVPEAGIAEFLGGVFGEVIEVIGAQGLHPAGPPFGCYVPTPDGFQVEPGFPATGPVEPSGRVLPATLPAGPAIVVLHTGPYSAVAAAYEAAQAWLVDHDGEATAPPWETYLDGPEVAEPRTLVYVPCRPR
ncbi:GyrI-like domain-containing protein [Pengzhenrongella frigida]|nr:GyrI-like domain-containing protein [Cellulomonas sp. HLT2-17]